MKRRENFPRMLAVAAVVSGGKTKILLRRRKEEPDKGAWAIFATWVRPGERLVEAVRRRLNEDAGICKVRSLKFTGKYYDEPGRHPGTFCIPFIFRVVIDLKEVRNSIDCRWFSREELSTVDLALDDRQILNDVLH